MKEGATPQRIIVQTYNYDMENDKILSFEDLIKLKGLNNDDVQRKINDEISKIIEEKNAINTEGYNLYKRIKRR